MTMKRFFKFMSMALVAALAISCYDDTKVWEKLDSLETKLTELTSQVNSVSSIVSALEQKVYVKAVTEVTGGYEIEFTDGKKVTVKDGKDGADAPEIGATKDVDGIYYWTLDGEWLLDAAGNKVPAGMGQPKLKTENGQWYISADGKEWALIGPDVACTIAKVTVADNVVTFTLADGTEIAVPLFIGLDITFSVAEENIYDKASVSFEYTVVGGTEKNRVTALCSGTNVVVTPKDATTGTITVGPLANADYEVVVWVTDGVSKTIFKTVKYAQGTFKTETTEVVVDFKEGTITVPVATNIEYVATVGEGCDWITLPAETRAAEVTVEDVVFNVAENTAMTSRSAKVYIAPKNELYSSLTIEIPVTQKGRANKAWSKEVTSYEGYDAAKPVRLAKYGDNILLANTTKVYVLDPATGEAVNTISMPEGVTAHSVLVDDAGNFMIAADAAYGATTTLYLVPDPTNPVPEELLSFDTNNYYCVEAGNFRVKGNVKEDAVVTLTVADGGSGAVIFWEIVDGEFTQFTFDWGSRSWDYVTGPYSGWAVATTCAAPAGTSIADGFFFIGYNGDYNLKYKVGEADWVTSYVTGSSWMENYNCISTATWKNNKYAAIVMGCHFNYDMADAVLLDVNDPAAAKHLYTHYGDGDAAWDWDAGVNNSWTGGGTYSDVLLATSEDTMLMVYVDSQYGTIGCVAIN